MTRIRHTPRLEPVRGYTWHDDAKCSGGGVDFFGPDTEGTGRGPVTIIERQAAAFCHNSGCPVIEQCREHGLNYPEKYGVWGGLTTEQREQVWRKRRRRSA